jgi:hypothetical protein
MPRRAHPADPAKLEAELSPAWRAALEEARRVCALGKNWQAVEPLQVLITQVTTLQLAARLRALGMSEDSALEAAAARLGVSVESVRTRHRRWYMDTRSKSHIEPAAPATTVASSGDAQPEPVTKEAAA